MTEAEKDMTYGDVYKEFCKKIGISKKMISDYRPCVDFYGVPFIPYAIVVWLKIGGTIIYVAECYHKEDLDKWNKAQHREREK
jgi:hypothetical protein